MQRAPCRRSLFFVADRMALRDSPQVVVHQFRQSKKDAAEAPARRGMQQRVCCCFAAVEALIYEGGNAAAGAGPPPVQAAPAARAAVGPGILVAAAPHAVAQEPDTIFPPDCHVFGEPPSIYQGRYTVPIRIAAKGVWRRAIITQCAATIGHGEGCG